MYLPPSLYSRRAAYLVLPLQHQQVGDLAEGQAQADDLSLVDVVGQLAHVDDARRDPGAPGVPFELFAVVAIGWGRRRGKRQSITAARKVTFLTVFLRHTHTHTHTHLPSGIPALMISGPLNMQEENSPADPLCTERKHRRGDS